MTPAATLTTPSAPPDVEDRPSAGTEGNVNVRYEEIGGSGFITYSVKLAQAAPPELRVSLELGREQGGVWAHIPELDVSAEGADVNDAFHNVYEAACAWLRYIDAERPRLGPDLAAQERFVPLADAPVFSWFKNFRFAD